MALRHGAKKDGWRLKSHCAVREKAGEKAVARANSVV